MKKGYNSPMLECMTLVKSTILCASNDGNGSGMMETGGGGTSGSGNGANGAPKRRVF